MPPGSFTNRPDATFWHGKRVFLTGITGFKGTWMAASLTSMGAQVSGLGLLPETQPSLYAHCSEQLEDVGLIDIRNKDLVQTCLNDAAPDIVIHMAAQPIVLKSYQEPVDTFETNINGTINLLEALRDAPFVKAILVVTSDKVYANSDQAVSFGEDAPLGGDDPYSASKACTEMVVHSYAKSYFAKRGIPLVTARAGNVIGGGDWSDDRLIPDIWRSINGGTKLEIRAPASTRPWQHVLDANNGYLNFMEAIMQNAFPPIAQALNFGPLGGPAVTVREIVEMFEKSSDLSDGLEKAETTGQAVVLEKKYLQVSAQKANSLLGWSPKLLTTDAVSWTADWYRRFDRGEAPWLLMQDQIDAHLQL